MASSWMAFCPVDWDSSVMDRWETTTLKWTPKVAAKVSERGICQLNSCGTLSNLFLSLFLSLCPPSNAPRHFNLISSFLGFQIFFLSPFPLFSLSPLSPPSLSPLYLPSLSPLYLSLSSLSLFASINLFLFGLCYRGPIFSEDFRLHVS